MNSRKARIAVSLALFEALITCGRCTLPPLHQNLAAAMLLLTSSRTVGGQVLGLAGNGLGLTLNGGSPMSITSNGPFAFPTPLADRDSYNVQVSSQPAGQACLGGSANTGTVAGANVTAITITCYSDLIAPTVSIANLHTNQSVETGFVIGNASDNYAVAAVEVSLDGGAYAVAPGTTTWRFPLPTGAATWREGSTHTIAARSLDLAGTYSVPTTIAVKKGTNRDVNGDGYPDVVVGAKTYNGGQGRVFIFHSSATGISSGAASAQAAARIDGVAGSYFGASVALGDINGDGYADAVVGSPGSASNTGWVYIFYSTGSGGITAAGTGGANLTITGENNGDSFGYSVAIGDLNGDGYGDLAVGASFSTSYAGKAYIFHSGGSTGINTSTAASANSLITGEAANNYFGRVAVADINGDGYADLMVGATGYSSSTGRVYIFYSSAGGIASTTAASANTLITGGASGDWFGTSLAGGDVNGDGYADIIVGAIGYSGFSGRAYIFHSPGAGGFAATVAAGGATRIIDFQSAGDKFGYSVALGDVNGDGYADAIVGAAAYGTGTGRAYVFHSSGAGITVSSATLANTVMDGTNTGDNFASSVALSDINGDGYTDALVTAPVYSGSAGMIEIHYSTATGVNSTAGTTLTGDSINNWFGTSVW